MSKVLRKKNVGTLGADVPSTYWLSRVVGVRPLTEPSWPRMAPNEPVADFQSDASYDASVHASTSSAPRCGSVLSSR